MAVAAFWSTSSSSIAKTSEPLSLSSRSKSLAASSCTVLSSEESSSESGTSTSKSVSSKMSFSPFLTAGGGVAASAGLALAGPALPGFLAGLACSDLNVLISSSLRGASSIES